MKIIGLYGTIENPEAISHDSGATLFVEITLLLVQKKTLMFSIMF